MLSLVALALFAAGCASSAPLGSPLAVEDPPMAGGRGTSLAFLGDGWPTPAPARGGS